MPEHAFCSLLVEPQNWNNSPVRAKVSSVGLLVMTAMKFEGFFFFLLSVPDCKDTVVKDLATSLILALYIAQRFQNTLKETKAQWSIQRTRAWRTSGRKPPPSSFFLFFFFCLNAGYVRCFTMGFDADLGVNRWPCVKTAIPSFQPAEIKWVFFSHTQKKWLPYRTFTERFKIFSVTLLPVSWLNADFH